VGTLERAIEAGCMVQPFVEDVKVSIDRSRLRSKKGLYDYVSLTGDMLKVSLVVRFRSSKVKASMRYIKEMHYPLMFIESVERD